MKVHLTGSPASRFDSRNSQKVTPTNWTGRKNWISPTLTLNTSSLKIFTIICLVITTAWQLTHRLSS